MHKIEGWEGNEEIEVEQSEEQEEVNNEEVVQETGFWSTPVEPEYVEQEPEKEPEYSLWLLGSNHADLNKIESYK